MGFSETPGHSPGFARHQDRWGDGIASVPRRASRFPRWRPRGWPPRSDRTDARLSSSRHPIKPGRGGRRSCPRTRRGAQERSAMNARQRTTPHDLPINTLGRVAPLALCLVLAAGIDAAGQEGGGKSGWVSLFNGKDLEGWTPKIKGYEAGENYGNTFRVEDGVLRVSYDQYPTFDGRFGHLFSKRKYSSYRLRIEYRFVGDQCLGGPAWALRNSGVMIHGQSPESMR